MKNTNKIVGFIKKLFIIMLILSIVISIDIYVIPFMWSKMINAKTSFVADFYGSLGFLILVISNAPLLLFTDLGKKNGKNRK